DVLTALLGSSGVMSLLGLSVLRDAELRLLSPLQERPAASQLSVTFILDGGSDGKIPPASAYHGVEIGQSKTGLLSFEDVDEIAIVAAPGSTAKYGRAEQQDDDVAAQAVQELQIHVEKMRYRVAVLDARDDEVLSEVQDFRGRFDSEYMAFYYPWVKTID